MLAAVLCGPVDARVRLPGAARAEDPAALEAVLEGVRDAEALALLVPWPPGEWVDPARAVLDRHPQACVLAVVPGKPTLADWRQAAALGFALLPAKEADPDGVQAAAEAALEAAGRLTLARLRYTATCEPAGTLPAARPAAPGAGAGDATARPGSEVPVHSGTVPNEPATEALIPTAAGAGPVPEAGGGREVSLPIDASLDDTERVERPRAVSAAATALPVQVPTEVAIPAGPSPVVTAGPVGSGPAIEDKGKASRLPERTSRPASWLQGVGVIAVVGAKGGVGTSTVAAGLAQALGVPGRPAALIELSPAGSDARYLFGLNGAPAGEPQAVDEGLWVVPGPIRRPEELAGALGAAEYAVLDLPPDGGVVRGGLGKVQLAVVVVTPEPAALERIGAVWSWLLEDVEMERVLLCVNRAGLPGGVQPRAIARACGLEPAVWIPESGAVRSGKMARGWRRALDRLARTVRERLGEEAGRRGRR
ncbi:AAA family ATPase [Thermaerobacter litoralis]